MLITATLPASLAVSVVALTAAADGAVQVDLVSSRPAVPCPACGTEAVRVHSRYIRTVTDLPWQGLTVRLHIGVRRFFCDRPPCPQRIFAERFPGLVAPHGRQTERLHTLLTAVGLALGGEAGGRLLAQLGIRRSPDTLLNLVRAAPQPARTAPRVLGIDDWSWRRGRRFGTILIDLERRAVVDLLPDRAVESVVAWLQAQPQIAVIARDRGMVYSEAATKGAPHALQVADRWHLLHNLADAVEEVLLQHRPALRAAVAAPAPVDTAAPVPSALPDTAPGPLTPNRPRQGQQRLSAVSQQRHARLVEQYQTIQQLAAAGVTVTEMADRLAVSRRTVYRYRALNAPPEPRRVHRSRRQRVLTPFEPYLLQRWQEGCHTGMRLYRELRAQGYTAGASNVMRFVAQLRREEAAGQPAGTAARARAGPTPTARHVAGLFLRRPETLDEEERGYLTYVRAADAAIATAYHLTQTFALMVRERMGERLDAWLDEAEAAGLPALRRFGKGLRADLAAVRAGLTEVWSNGQTEGHVHRLKLLKRQMYGRAGFAVLRQRVLLAG